MKKIFIFVLLVQGLLLSAETYYVSPVGRDSDLGLEPDPRENFGPWLTWGKAFHTAQPGDTVFFRGGTYLTEVTNGQGIRYIPGLGLGNDGTSDNWIVYLNYDKEVPILDCSGSIASYDGVFNHGIYLSGVDYVLIKGLQVKNVNQREGERDICYGIRTDHSNSLIFENIDVSFIMGPGFETTSEYYITYLNCDSHDNVDYYSLIPGDYGQGWHGGNQSFDDGYKYLYGCKAWNNADQGFSTSGTRSLMVYEKCWSFNNGVALEGSDGHGFKMGYWNTETSVDPVIIYKNCLAVNNVGDGWAGNERANTPSGIYHLYNNFSYNNGRFGYAINNTSSSDTKESKRIAKNNIGFQNWINMNAEGEYSHSNNTWDHSVAVDASDFVASGLDVSWLLLPRDSLGNLPDIPFGKLASDSDLKDKGVDVGIIYYGPFPDIGWVESNTTSGGNEYPFVGITSPVTNSSYDAPTFITIEALAEDSDGSISLVEFFANGEYIGDGSLIDSRYSVSFSISLAGDFSITAVATDNEGAVATSSAVFISTHVISDPGDPDDPTVESDLINIFPNPNTGEFELDIFAENLGAKTNISIVNMDGQVVFNKFYTDEVNSTLRLSMTDPRPGTYVLIVSSLNEIISTKKFVAW